MSRLAILIAAILVLTVTASRGATAPQGVSGQTRTLEERVAQLEARVLVLEQAAAGPVAAPPQAPAAGLLFEASGTGGAETDFFDVAGRVEVCWDVSGRSPSGAYGGEASFYLTPASGSGSSSVSDKTGTGCTFANLRAGRFYIKVFATSWSIWRVTIKAA